MTASEIAVLRPTKTYGSAAGKRTFTNTCVRDAESDRTSSSRSDGVACSPVAVAITIGKKQTRNTITTFGPCPNPIQSTRIGAIATFGTALIATSTGVSARSSARDAAISTASSVPAAIASAYPSSVSTSVTPSSCGRYERCRQTSRATSQGEGRMNVFQPNASFNNHHAANSARIASVGRTTAPAAPAAPTRSRDRARAGAATLLTSGRLPPEPVVVEEG